VEVGELWHGGVGMGSKFKTKRGGFGGDVENL